MIAQLFLYSCMQLIFLPIYIAAISNPDFTFLFGFLTFTPPFIYNYFSDYLLLHFESRFQQVLL